MEELVSQKRSETELFRTENLVVYFKVRGGSKLFVHAVDGVDFTAKPRRSTGIVGESGSGKTTLAKALLGVVKPTSGKVLFEGRDINALKGDALRDFRRRVQMVYQDPFDAIDPLYSVYDAVAEGLRILRLYSSKEELDERVARALEAVKLTPWSEYAYRRITALSGGQRQRVAVARTLAMDPEVFILDEPVSMLDASVKGEIIKLMDNLKPNGKSFILISHDIATVRFFTDELAVMYLGKIVESGPSGEVVSEPLHPYTQALIAAVPVPDPSVSVRSLAKGEIPSAVAPPSGCRFHPRCPLAQEICSAREPELREVRPGRFVACHFAS